jgi:pimeloyl-ACP methyl ester carboxylesterase
MRPVYLLTAVIAAAFTTQVGAPQASAQTPKVVMEEMMVPSEAGVEIYVRNKRPADMTAFRPERTLLFVHGATYPAHTSFDLKLDGMSWMDYIAARGYDVYLLDIRGYGKSTRPREMDDKPDANAPVVRGVTAVKDISAVVDFILKRRSIPRLNLLGWSWGTTLMTTYTTENPARSSASCSMRRRGFERHHRSRGRPARSAPTARSRASRRRAAG